MSKQYIRVEDASGVTHYSTKYYVLVGGKICINLGLTVKVVNEIK